MYSGAFQQKEPPKFSPSDWHTANNLLTSSSNRQRQISHDVRQESEATRNVKGKSLLPAIAIYKKKNKTTIILFLFRQYHPLDSAQYKYQSWLPCTRCRWMEENSYENSSKCGSWNKLG